MSAKAHFQLQFKQFEHGTKWEHIVVANPCQYKKQAWYMQTFIVHTKACFKVHTNIHFHTKAYHIVHTNFHCAHQSVLHGTYKHSLFTPRHITQYIQAYILHTKAYCIAHTKHSYCTPVYKTRSCFELCHLCVWFHIVRSYNTSDAHSAHYEYCKLPLLQPHVGYVEMSFALQDTHLGSPLVHNVVTQSTQHKIWLPHPHYKCIVYQQSTLFLYTE